MKSPRELPRGRVGYWINYDYKKKYRIPIARGVGHLRCIVFLLYDYDDYVVMKKRTLSIPGS